MGPREIARSNDGHANSIGAEKKLATAKPKPWESEPYNYEVQKNAGSSSLSNPRQDYVERVHGPHQDSDSIPSDDDAYGYAPSAFSATSDLHASDPYAGDQGTLAGHLEYVLPEYDNKHLVTKAVNVKNDPYRAIALGRWGGNVQNKKTRYQQLMRRPWR
jgi:hypothetical protein